MRSATLRRFGIRMAVAALAFWLQGGVAHAADTVVAIDNFTFAPAAVTVKIGTTVTWQNRDDIPHTVVSAGNFRSKAMDTNGSFSYTFTTSGDYKYFCSLHPHMTGTIKVE
jgi:plastocyanin